MPLTDVATLRAAFAPEMDSQRNSELDRLVAAASDWIEAAAGLILQRATFAEVLDGYMALGPGRDVLELDTRRRPVIHSGADLVTVTEDGVSLVVVTGYSTTADVILSGHGDLYTPVVRLRRRNRKWADTYSQNVTVSYKAGYDTSTSIASIPGRVVQLANEVAWLMFQSGGWIGKASSSAMGQATSWEKDLSPLAQETLDGLRRLANA